MDAASLAIIGSIVVAAIAAIPTIGGLLAQNRKDKKQQEMDMNSAALNAATAIIAPLQAELARVQARNIELEQALIDKVKENGQLVQDGIDKDATLRTLKYNMDTMQSRLDTYEAMVSSPSDKKEHARVKRKGDDAVAALREVDDQTDDTRRQEAIARVQGALDDIKSKSTTNNDGDITNTSGGTATEEIKK